MNLHRVACRLGQHTWVTGDEWEGWRELDGPGDDAGCLHCGKPHPENMEAVCAARDHVWGEWVPLAEIAPTFRTPLGDRFSAVFRDDMSDYMLGSMLGGKVVEDSPATSERECTRCGGRETDRKTHMDFPVNQSMTGLLGVLDGEGGAVWTEDKLNSPESSDPL